QAAAAQVVQRDVPERGPFVGDGQDDALGDPEVVQHELLPGRLVGVFVTGVDGGDRDRVGHPEAARRAGGEREDKGGVAATGEQDVAGAADDAVRDHLLQGRAGGTVDRLWTVDRGHRPQRGDDVELAPGQPLVV